MAALQPRVASPGTWAGEVPPSYGRGCPALGWGRGESQSIFADTARTHLGDALGRAAEAGVCVGDRGGRFFALGALLQSGGAARRGSGLSGGVSGGLSGGVSGGLSGFLLEATSGGAYYVRHWEERRVSRWRGRWQARRGRGRTCRR